MKKRVKKQITIPPNPTVRKRTIFIVENDPDILSLLVGTFLLQNFRVYSATSTGEAEETYKMISRSVDIVLLNGNIAGEEGIGVVIAIRRINPDQKIVLIAGRKIFRVNAMKVKGLTIVIMKPLTADKVVEKVIGLIEYGSK